MRAGLHPAAAAELHEAFRWYESKTRNLGCDLRDEVDRAIETISQTPTAWPFYRSDLSVRRFLLHRFPFALLYRVTGGEIQVIAVAHLRRKPGYWADRLDK